jgi:putative transcriptional regulator
MRRFNLDPKNLPALRKDEQARLDAMTDAEITAAAELDPDNPPLTDEELERMRLARRVRAVRARAGLSQRQFAEAYRINVARLRDLEQGRTQPDGAMLAYLAVIEREPEAVNRALRKEKRVGVQGFKQGEARTIMRR